MSHCAKLTIALCFISISCTSGKMRQKNLPAWIQDTSKYCPPDHLCTLGEGSSHTKAEKNARESLAKIFETRVAGKIESHTSREYSWYQREQQEIFDETLQGVQILRHHKTQGQFFALASLHKKKSARYILRKAKHENANLVQHYQQNNMTQFRITYNRWQGLQDRYFFLTGKRITPEVRYEQMLEKMHTLRTFRAHKKILIVSEADDIKQYLINNLVKQGYRTTDKKNRPFDIKLVPKMNVRQLHFNVPRFEKYEFSLSIKIYNSMSIQKNMLSLKKIQTGRSQKHARELVMKNIFIGLEEKIDSLLKE